MHAVKRFEPDKGFRLATYAMWWIRAAIQEYVLRSWSLVKIGTTAAQKRLFFNLRKVKGQIAALDDGSAPSRPDQADRDHALGHRGRRRLDEPAPHRRRLAQRADARRRGRLRVAGLAGRRHAETRRRRSATARNTASAWASSPNAMDVLNDRERAIFQARRLQGESGDARRAGAGIQRQPRAHPPDRGPRVREGAGRGADGRPRQGARAARDA